MLCLHSPYILPEASTVILENKYPYKLVPGMIIAACISLVDPSSLWSRTGLGSSIFKSETRKFLSLSFKPCRFSNKTYYIYKEPCFGII